MDGTDHNTTPPAGATGEEPATRDAGLALSPVHALRVIRRVLGDKELSFGEKVAVTAVILQADGATGCAWVSYRQLERDYQLSDAPALKALSHKGGSALGKYLTLAGVGPRRASRFQVLVEPPNVLKTGTSEPPHVLKTGTSEPPNVLKTGTSEPPHVLKTGTILTPEEKERPPLPPGGPGGVCEVSSASPFPDGPTDATGGETYAAVLARIDGAYRTVFGRRMPIPWFRKVARAWHGGDQAWLAEVDADAIRGGQAITAGSTTRAFGLGWVRQFLETRAARRQAETAANNRRGAGAEGDQAGADLDEARRQAEQTEAQRRDQWDQLDAAGRERFLSDARRKYPMAKPALLERLAAALACPNDGNERNPGNAN